MKNAIVSLVLIFSAPSIVFAQAHDMKSMESHSTMKRGKSANTPVTKHHAVGVVRKIDRASGKVTLAHDPVKSLNWPAMTMAFAVKPKALLDKFVLGEKVSVEIAQQGKEYIVVAVKAASTR